MFTKVEVRLFILIVGCLILGAGSRGFLAGKIEYFKIQKQSPDKYSGMENSVKPANIQGKKEISPENLLLPKENHISEKGVKEIKTTIKKKVKFPINLNTATETQLMEIKGIGPHLSKTIIEYRNSNGPFTSVNQIINVKGIGEKKLKKFSPYLSI